MRITISGKPGAGKTTIAKLLAEKLKLRFIEMGKIAQKIALRRGVTIGELMELARTDPSIDKEIDDRQKELGKKEDHFVIDGRISFFFIPNAVHVFLDVDEQTAAERIFAKAREPDEPWYRSVEQVRADIRRRLFANQDQYRKYYGIDYLNLKNYDVVIDTTGKTQAQVLKEVLAKVQSVMK